MASVFAKLSREIGKNGLLPTAQKSVRLLISKPAMQIDRAFDKLLSTKTATRWVQQRSSTLAESILSRQEAGNDDYKNYLALQVHKSYRNSSYLRFWRFWGRTGLIERLNEILPKERTNLAILCVGCRDTRELNNVARICKLKNITGVDLFSKDPRIDIGDMHNLSYSDNQFDLMMSVDSLEHSFDPAKALSEFRRVVKTGGLIGIELPVNFTPDEVDRYDCKSLDDLLNTAKLPKDSVVHFEQFEKADHQKIRVIVRNT